MKLASLFISILGVTIAISSAAVQVDGTAAYAAFLQWKVTPENAKLAWEPAILKYETKIKADGVQPDLVFAEAPKFDPNPNPLMVEAIKVRRPGTALDVGMGQGWKVTRFDISKVGLERAKASARNAGLKINSVLVADEEFDSGISRSESSELLKIFDGLTILKYEEPIAMLYWVRKEMRLVRLIAQKPQ